MGKKKKKYFECLAITKKTISNHLWAEEEHTEKMFIFVNYNDLLEKREREKGNCGNSRNMCLTYTKNKKLEMND